MRSTTLNTVSCRSVQTLRALKFVFEEARGASPPASSYDMGGGWEMDLAGACIRGVSVLALEPYIGEIYPKP